MGGGASVSAGTGAPCEYEETHPDTGPRARRPAAMWSRAATFARRCNPTRSRSRRTWAWAARPPGTRSPGSSTRARPSRLALLDEVLPDGRDDGVEGLERVRHVRGQARRGVREVVHVVVRVRCDLVEHGASLRGEVVQRGVVVVLGEVHREVRRTDALQVLQRRLVRDLRRERVLVEPEVVEARLVRDVARELRGEGEQRGGDVQDRGPDADGERGSFREVESVAGRGAGPDAAAPSPSTLTR